MSFTVSSDRAQESVISEQLATTLAEILTVTGGPLAVYLVGSFGRGEGSMRYVGGRWCAVNDYDLLVVDDDCHCWVEPLVKLGRSLAQRFSTDFVDIGCMQRKILADLPPTIQNYEFKYGARLLFGVEIRNELPDYRPDMVPTYEFVRLICNRAAGIIGAEHGGQVDMGERYCRYQFQKACIAIGDTVVYLGRRYHYLYRERANAFSQLRLVAQEIGLSSDEIKIVNDAYEAKCNGQEIIAFEVDSSVVKSMLRKTYCGLASSAAGFPINDFAQAERVFVRQYRCGMEGVNTIMQLFSRRARRVGKENARQNMLNQILFSQVFFCVNCSVRNWGCRLGYLKRFISVPGAMSLPSTTASAFVLWQRFCH